MIRRKLTEKAIGGNYTWYDTAVDGEGMEPLLYCIGCAFPPGERVPLEHHVEGLFELGGAGGDPSWRITRFTDDMGQIVYSAEYDTYLTGVDAPYGEYDEATVKSCFAKTMREYARVHPESKENIDQLIQKYRLD